jgi:subtilisin family serine protease
MKIIKYPLLLISGVVALSFPNLVIALENSLGSKGINAYILHQEPYNLIGRKIALGQIEIGRPSKFGFDKAASWNPPFKINGLFKINELAIPNENVDNHANMVAMVMVSNDKKLPGVAPGAKLFSSGVGSLKNGGQPEECLASIHVAARNGGDVRAINFSFGESLERDKRENAILDGNALLTQCVDWSARVHNVLYVIAGNQGKGGIPIPTDQYNGITAAYTAQKEGEFAKIDFANLSALPQGIGSRLIKREINVGKRRAISLAAPGNKISLYNLDGKMTQVSGTSFAAPHITASVALLQEFGDKQLREKQSNWSLDSRRHEVMKTVLLNSAEKIKDTGDGFLLGMTRTILDKQNNNWFKSDAYQNPETPLDMQSGTGQLNVFRAYQQFSAGQWKPDNLVPPLGWDFNTITTKQIKDYQLKSSLPQGSFVSLTLTWDRLVELNDTNNNQTYDLGENFTDQGLNNLDLYLMPADSNNIEDSVCSSSSKVDNTEHIFCPIPSTGDYKIRIYYSQQVNNKNQTYSLAWWTFNHD